MKKEPTLEEWKEIEAKAKDFRDNLNELLEPKYLIEIKSNIC
jgi:hypothetical protein